MIDRFEELLKELGIALSIALHPDRLGACKLRIGDECHVQLECDAHQENLLIATFICDVPPGKFRENILKDALKSNGPFPKNGTLAYSERNNKLVLFSYLRISNLHGSTLAEFLNALVDKANAWRMGVETGHTSQLVAQTLKSASGIFGLKP
jgi:hypothetical protein